MSPNVGGGGSCVVSAVLCTWSPIKLLRFNSILNLWVQVFPINPTIIRVMRVLRIARVLKLLKMAKGIRALLDTVMQALPQVLPKL